MRTLQLVLVALLVVLLGATGCDALGPETYQPTPTPPDSTPSDPGFTVEFTAEVEGIRQDLWWMEGDELDFTVTITTEGASKNIAALRMENSAGELLGSGYSTRVDKLASRADSQLVAVFTASDGSVYKEIVPDFKLTFVPEDEWIVVGITTDYQLIEFDTQGKHEAVITDLPTDLRFVISSTPDRSSYYFAADEYPLSSSCGSTPVFISRDGSSTEVAFTCDESELYGMAYTGVSPQANKAWFQVNDGGTAQIALANLDGSEVRQLTYHECTGPVETRFPCEGGSDFAAWGREGKYLYTSIGGKDAERRLVYDITRFNVLTGEKEKLYRTEPDGPYTFKALGYEADGLVPLNIGSWEESGIPWTGWLDLSSGELVHNRDHYGLDFSPDGRYAVGLSRRGNARETHVMEMNAAGKLGNPRVIDLRHGKLYGVYVLPRPVH